MANADDRILKIAGTRAGVVEWAAYWANLDSASPTNVLTPGRWTSDDEGPRQLKGLPLGYRNRRGHSEEQREVSSQSDLNDHSRSDQAQSDNRCP